LLALVLPHVVPVNMTGKANAVATTIPIGVETEGGVPLFWCSCVASAPWRHFPSHSAVCWTRTANIPRHEGVMIEKRPRNRDNNKIVVETERGVSLFHTVVLLKAVVCLASSHSCSSCTRQSDRKHPRSRDNNKLVSKQREGSLCFGVPALPQRRDSISPLIQQYVGLKLSTFCGMSGL
jgi:hypothetical protein